jgi:tetratricopeptide (TPR) repeat protein
MDRTEQLARFLASDPNNLPLACDYLDSAIAAGRVDVASDALQGLLDRHGPIEALLARQSRLFLISGHLPEAIAVLEGLRDEHPEDLVYLHDLAFCWLAWGELERAEHALQSSKVALAEQPMLAALWARIPYLQRDMATASARLDAALACAPTDASLRGLQALVLLDAGNEQVAFALASSVLQAAPDQADALLVTATQALWQRDPSRALHWAGTLVDRQPANGRALSVLGQALLLNGRMADALGVLERSVSFMPDHIGTWHVLAWARLLSDDISGAKAAYESAYAIDRNFADTHGGLGLIHAIRGETEEAQASIRRALRLDPRSATALYAQVLLANGDASASAAEKLAADFSALPELNGIDAAQVLQSLERLLKSGQGAR